MTYRTVNPYTNETVKEYPDATLRDVEVALDNAESLFKKWKKETPASRADELQDVADVMEKNRDELAKVLTTEMGKLYSEALSEVDLCINIAEYYAKNGSKMLEPKTIETNAPGTAKVEKHSTGILMMVEPWNFPYYQIMRVYAPNFMVGNPMILKHSSNTPASAEAFARLIKDSSAPNYSLTNLFVDYEQVSDIIADPRVQGVALTGSERGGRSVAETAGKNLKKNTMELGGSDAFIVLDDADIDKVADNAWHARLFNAGQVCTSSKRFIVHESMYDEFLKRLKENFASVVPGDPMDEKTTLAPLSTQKAKDDLSAQVERAVDNGATLYYGKDKIDLPGQFFQPTILTDVTRDNPAYFEEFFGPVAQVYKVYSDEEAIDLANDSAFGLGCTIFSGDDKRAQTVASRIESGMVFINSQWLTLPELPFGGVKTSGYGREMSEIGLNTFANEQLIYTAN